MRVFRSIVVAGQVLLLLLAGALLGASVFFIHVPGLQTSTMRLGMETRKLVEQVAQMRVENNSLEVIRSKKREYLYRIKEMRELIPVLEKIVPDDAESGAFTRTLSKLAAANGVRLQSIVPMQPVPYNYYTEMPFVVKVEGTYPALTIYFRALAMQKRLISVSALTLEPAPSSRSRGIRPDLPVTGTFVADIYFNASRPQPK
jgi:Tfp pilus assembly protein PilO